MVLLTSRTEGIPLVVLEAFASGKAVVSSDAGAVRELVDASTGALIEIGDGEVDAFAKTIDRLISEPALRRELGAEGRRRVERDYDIRQSREAYRRLLD
jgi:glycosyltransferase involved in cell wall biosynthesis